MNREQFIEEVKKLGLNVSHEHLELLEKLRLELINYNKHTNLTRITELEEVYLKHYYDSLTITKVIDLNKISNLIDLGTGAGFPGLIIKIFFPNLEVTLLDSNNKKTEWLNFVSEKLGLKVTVVHDRIEHFSLDNLNKFDIVTSRAVANLRVLSELSLPLVKKGGYFIPLKGKIEDELKEASDTISILNGELIETNEFNLYNNEGIRNILLIKKRENTELKNIRTYDKILKKPLKK